MMIGNLKFVAYCDMAHHDNLVTLSLSKGGKPDLRQHVVAYL